jgi:hypothetical protein
LRCICNLACRTAATSNSEWHQLPLLALAPDCLAQLLQTPLSLTAAAVAGAAGSSAESSELC